MTNVKSARSRNLGYQFGLIGFVSLSSFLRNVTYATAIHPRFLARALLVLSTSLVTAPMRLWERIRYGRRIAAVKLQPPIFVIGHWRSGTTHLHNLISQDPTLGYLTMYQAMVPGCSLVGERWLKPFLARVVPEKRPMDNVVWPADAPQEEEIPLAKLTPYSLYVRFLFPRKAAALFRQYVLPEGASPRVGREIKQRYCRLLQVASIHAGGRRLVLKNPVNTGRVRLLLELFPDAKFVHIHRSPYEVYASTVNMHQRMLAVTTLQALPRSGTSEAILALYEDMMHRYLEDRTLIPRGNLVEVRFEDLDRDPLGEMRRIYQTLGLDSYAQARPAIETYVAAQRSYKKNDLTLSDLERANVERRWAFAFEELGYGTEVGV